MEKPRNELPKDPNERVGNVFDADFESSKTALERIKGVVSVEHLAEEQQLAITAYGDKFINEVVQSGNDGFYASDEVMKDLFKGNGVPTEVSRIAAGSPRGLDNNRLAPEIKEGNRLFAATLIDYVNQLHRNETDLSDIPQLIPAKIERTFMSFSPNAFSYVGSFESELELLTLANKTPLGRGIFGDRLAGEMVYNHTFDDWEVSADMLLANRSPIESIDLISSVASLAVLASGNNYSRPMVQKMEIALRDVAESSQSTPLVKLVAEELLDRSKKTVWSTRRAVSSEDFPALDGRGNVIQVSKDMAGAFNSGRLDFIADSEGHLVNVSDWRAQNDLKITEDQARLLEVAHRPAISASLEQALGFSLTDVNLSVQLEFLKFAAEANHDRYSRLSQALYGFEDKQERIGFVESFLALEFGDDFGDRLIAIAESRRDGSEQIFEDINQIRQQSAEIAEYFAGDQVDLSSELKQAWTKRTTEVLVALANKDTPEKEKKEAIEVLAVLNYTTSEIRKGLKRELTDITSTIKSRFRDSFLALKSANGVTITLRPKLTPGYPQRIGWTVKVPKELISERVEGNRDRRLNLRLDLDQYGLSLDMGQDSSLRPESPNIATLVAETLAKGEKLLGRTSNKHHVREAFEARKDFTPEQFEVLVNEFAKKLQLPDLELTTTVPDYKKDAS